MTNEERDVITRFIERVGGAGGSGFGSVPSTGQAPGSQGLPPVDHEADGLIGELFGKYPEARYRITQLAYVQEQALNAAQRRMQAMQQQLQQLQSQQGGGGQGPSPWGQGAQPQQQAQPQSRGFLSGLFGGNRASAPPPPQAQQAYQAPPQQYAQPQYAPPAMMQQQGSGFLGGALRTAAGVAGGLVAGQALMNLFEGGGRGLFGGASEPAIGAPAGFGGGFAGGGDPGWVGSPDASPVSDAFAPGFAPDPMDQGGALKSDPGSDPYAAGQGAWQQADAGGGGWQDAPPDQGGGWQDAGAVDQGGADQGGGLQGGWDDAAGGGDDGGWTDSSSDA